MPRRRRNPILQTKWSQLFLLALAELLAMALWFSASAVVPQLTAAWSLDGGERAWLTMSVQLGFVVGALASAILNLADRAEPPRLIALATLAGALCNAAIPALGAGYEPALVLRFLTGVALAGVYPPGMKIVATWCKRDRGFGIGILVGALTVGSALPHLLNAGAGGMPPWRTVLYGASACAVVGAILAGLFVRTGPDRHPSAPFEWRFAFRGFAERAPRLANFGYLGHMWELYAMWAWCPIFLLASYRGADWSEAGARVAGFAVVGVGALGCILAGYWSDRIGRTTVTIASLALSGACAALAGFCFGHPGIATAVCLVWGFAVVADSAQFSTAVTELADKRYLGTALTAQTCVGFLLTLITLRVVPPLVESVGWRWVFWVLVPGPLFGMLSMVRLRAMPEAERMAGGAR